MSQTELIHFHMCFGKAQKKGGRKISSIIRLGENRILSAAAAAAAAAAATFTHTQASYRYGVRA